MKQTACPRCGYSNNGVDTACANCSASLPDADERPPRRSLRLQIGTVPFFVMLAAAAFTGYAVFGGGNPAAPPAINNPSEIQIDPIFETQDNSVDAWRIMCDYMRERVTTPGTATFPDYGHEHAIVRKLGGTSYDVRGFVDFELNNESRTRRYYKGVVTQIAHGLWRLDSYEMGRWYTMGRYFAQ